MSDSWKQTLGAAFMSQHLVPVTNIHLGDFLVSSRTGILYKVKEIVYQKEGVFLFHLKGLLTHKGNVVDKGMSVQPFRNTDLKNFSKWTTTMLAFRKCAKAMHGLEDFPDLPFEDEDTQPIHMDAVKKMLTQGAVKPEVPKLPPIAVPYTKEELKNGLT